MGARRKALCKKTRFHYGFVTNFSRRRCERADVDLNVSVHSGLYLSSLLAGSRSKTADIQRLPACGISSVELRRLAGTIPAASRNRSLNNRLGSLLEQLSQERSQPSRVGLTAARSNPRVRRGTPAQNYAIQVCWGPSLDLMASRALESAATSGERFAPTKETPTWVSRGAEV